jgi:hypothetical protein
MIPADADSPFVPVEPQIMTVSLGYEELLRRIEWLERQVTRSVPPPPPLSYPFPPPYPSHPWAPASPYPYPSTIWCSVSYS